MVDPKFFKTEDASKARETPETAFEPVSPKVLETPEAVYEQVLKNGKDARVQIGNVIRTLGNLLSVSEKQGTPNNEHVANYKLILEKADDSATEITNLTDELEGFSPEIPEAVTPR